MSRGGDRLLSVTPAHRLKVLVVPLLAVVALTGCGAGSSEEDATKLVEDFYAAVNDADGDKACAFVSDEALKEAYTDKATCVKDIGSLGEDNVRRSADSIASQGRETRDTLMQAYHVLGTAARAQGRYPDGDGVGTALERAGFTTKQGDDETAASSPLENRLGPVVIGPDSTPQKLVLYAGTASGEVVRLISPLRGAVEIQTVKQPTEEQSADAPLIRITEVHAGDKDFLVLFHVASSPSTERYTVAEVDGDLRIVAFR